MPVSLPTVDFHAQHSPLGANASFTVGRHGAQGGFGIEMTGPAAQDVFVALVRPNQSVMALPFYQKESVDTWQTFPTDSITRTMGWSSDTWQAGDLTFGLLTPFGPIPDLAIVGDGEMRRHLCPVIFAANHH